MKKIAWLFPLLFGVPLFAQTDAIQGYCDRGGTHAQVSGLQATNWQLGAIPACTVTVYLTGTSIKATIYADNTSTPLSNPFTATASTSPNPGYWIFWAATGQGYDVTMSGGGGVPTCTTQPNCYAIPITKTDLKVGGTGGGGGCTTSGTAGQLQGANGSGGCQPAQMAVNSTELTQDTAPNFIDSTTVHFTNPSTNQITATAGSGLTIQAEDVTLDGLFAPGFNQTLDFNSTLPAPPAGRVNAAVQTDPTTGRVSFNVPSTSAPALRMGVLEDATHVFVPFGSCVLTSSNFSLVSPDSGCDALSGYTYFFPGGLFNHNVSANMTWSGAVLPSWLPAGNVVGVSIVANTTGYGAGPISDCGGGVTCPGWATQNSATQNVVPVSGATGLNFGSIQASVSQSYSVYCGCAGLVANTSVLQIGLLVEFSGVTNPDPSNDLNIGYGLAYSSRYKSLTTDPSYPFQITPKLTADLPLYSASGAVAWVSDNTQTSPGAVCTGSGTYGSDYALCTSTISGWRLLADMGSTGFGVTQVTNSDNSLTFTPNTGHVIGSLNVANPNYWTADQRFFASVELSGGTSALVFNGDAGTVDECALSNGSGNTPKWRPCPGGTVGPGTTGYVPKFATSSTIGNSAIDDGVTTAGHVTITEPTDINSTGPSQTTYTYNSTPLVPGGATDAVIGVNSSGKFVVSEAGAAESEVCTAANAATNTGCQGTSGSLNVNGTPVSSPNLQDSASVTLGVSGSNIQASCTAASTSQIGCVEPDGVTTGISGGKLVAIGAAPSGAAGGDLSGTYPNPTVAKVNGAAVPTSSSYVGTNSSGQIVAATGPPIGAYTDILSNGKTPGTMATSQAQYQTLAANSSVTLLNYSSGDGYVSSIWIAGTGAPVPDLFLDFYYNGEAEPAITMPLRYFFQAYGLGSTSNFTNRFFGVINVGSNQYGYASHIPIPFNGGMKIVLRNTDPSNSVTPLFWNVQYQTGVTDNWTNTQRLEAIPYYSQACTLDSTVPMFNAASVGVGRFLGLSWYMTGSTATTQEGDFSFYNGGATSSPFYKSTGTEDYPLGAYNWQGIASPYAYNMMAGQAGVYYSGGAFPSTSVGLFRFHLDDPIIFSSGFNITWGCGESSHGSSAGATIAGTAWYYRTLSTNATTGYAHHVNLTIPSGQRPATDITYVPRIVAFNVTLGNGAVAPTLTNLKSIANGGDVTDGQKDIIFTDTSENQYPHEVLQWNATSGAYVAVVLVPSVLAASGATVEMHWGNASATNTQNPGQLWRYQYNAVNHLVNAGVDSTWFANTMTATGSPTAGTGMFGGGYTLNGSSQYLAAATLPYFPSGSVSRTYSAWFKLGAGASGCNSIIGSGTNVTAGRVEIGYCFSGTPRIFADSNTGDVAVNWASDTNWHKIDVAITGPNITNLVIYLDGVAQTVSSSISQVLGTTLNNWTIGRMPGTAADFFNGQIAEPRALNYAMSADQVLNEYKNEVAPATYWTVSSVVTP